MDPCASHKRGWLGQPQALGAADGHPSASVASSRQSPPNFLASCAARPLCSNSFPAAQTLSDTAGPVRSSRALASRGLSRTKNTSPDDDAHLGITASRHRTRSWTMKSASRLFYLSVFSLWAAPSKCSTPPADCAVRFFPFPQTPPSDYCASASTDAAAVSRLARSPPKPSSTTPAPRTRRSTGSMARSSPRSTGSSHRPTSSPTTASTSSTSDVPFGATTAACAAT